MFAVLAIILMALDRRGGWLVQARYYLSAAAYPLQRAVSSPGQALRWTQDSLTARATLQAQNAVLRARDQELSLKLMRFEALVHENAELRQRLQGVMANLSDARHRVAMWEHPAQARGQQQVAGLHIRIAGQVA